MARDAATPSPSARPDRYELAFSHRNVPHTGDLPIAAARHLTGRHPRSALELACGPGSQVREWHRRGLWAAARDVSGLGQDVRAATKSEEAYVVELSHPRAVGLPSGCPFTTASRTAVRDGITLTTEWGAEGHRDPFSQTDGAHPSRGGSRRWDAYGYWLVDTQRPWLAQERSARVAIAGGRTIGRPWGDFSLDRVLGGVGDWPMILGLTADG